MLQASVSCGPPLSWRGCEHAGRRACSAGTARAAGTARTSSTARPAPADSAGARADPGCGCYASAARSVGATREELKPRRPSHRGTTRWRSTQPAASTGVGDKRSNRILGCGVRALPNLRRPAAPAIRRECSRDRTRRCCTGCRCERPRALVRAAISDSKLGGCSRYLVGVRRCSAARIRRRPHASAVRPADGHPDVVRLWHDSAPGTGCVYQRGAGRGEGRAELQAELGSTCRYRPYRVWSCAGWRVIEPELVGSRKSADPRALT